MRLVLFIGALVALAILAACGDGDGDSEGGQLLHLRESDISEDAYRDVVRAMLMQPGASDFCQSLHGLSAEEIVRASGTPSPNPTALPGSTPITGQTPNAQDLERAAGIMQEECERIAP